MKLFYLMANSYQKERVKNKYKVDKAYNEETGVDQEKDRNNNSIHPFIHLLMC